jgi:uncharacterized repeat protein (TIGR03803 family)
MRIQRKGLRMRGTKLLIRLKVPLAILAMPLFATNTWAATEKVYSFNSNDGAYSDSNVIFDAAGNLYGTTAYGGGGGSCSAGCGTVFELSRKSGGIKETVLHRFDDNGKDGYYPYAGLVFDSSGNLYGTTAAGGDSTACVGGCGTVFELTPQAGGAWTETVLHSFDSTDGYYPEANLILDASGNLYGSTPAGGAYGYGTVFELTATPDGKWTEQVLYNFDGGYGSYGNLVSDASGNLYGTTGGGGAYGHGTVFELTPNADGGWTETILHSFNGSDGLQPLAGLILKSGDLYGTTISGGAYGSGTVFELMPTSGGSWTESVLRA